MPVMRRKSQYGRRGTPLGVLHLSAELERYFESLGLRSLESLYCALMEAPEDHEFTSTESVKSVQCSIRDYLGPEVIRELDEGSKAPMPPLGLIY